MKQSRILVCVAALLSGTAIAPQVYAQDAAAADRPSGGIEDIVVTAQRREERLQDVPVAVQALSVNALEQRGIARAFDLPNAVPGLSINRASNMVLYYLRGVGNPSQAPGSDPSVASYIDGIYQVFPNMAMLSLNNIERVEVLKGPQGTLFGRNATGGLIQVVTKTPTNDPTLDVKIGYDNFQTISGSGYVSGGSGNVSADLAISYSNQREGWGRNVWTPDQAGTVLFNGAPITLSPMADTRVGINRDFAIASKVVFRLTDDLTIKIAGAYARNEGDQGLYRDHIVGSKALIVQTGVTDPYTKATGFWDTNNNVNNWGINQQTQVSAEITYDMGSVTLKSTTAYINARADTIAPSPTQPKIESPGSPQVARAENPNRALSQEIQLLSNSKGPFQWILGGYFLHNRNGFDPLHFYRGPFIDEGIMRDSVLRANSYAAFAQGSYDVTPELRLTGGLRFTYDQLSASQYYMGTIHSTIPTPAAQQVQGVLSNVVPEQRTHFQRLTWRAAVDYHVTPDVMLFATVNSGYKAGTYNIGSMCTLTVAIGQCPAANIAAPVKPETLVAYEAGFKSEFFDRMVRFNASAFYYDFKNLQLNTLTGTPVTSLLQNAAKARIQGIDAELDIAPTENITLNGAIEILDAKYKDFPNAAVFVPRTAAPYGNASFVLANAAGNTLPRAPKFSATLGATWTIPLGKGSLALNGNLTYNSGFYWEPSNRVQQPSYTLVNLEATFSPDDHWSMKVWGRNVGNTKYYTFVDASPYGERGNVGAPATYGATLEYKFR